jgi:hypothetical protein
MTRFMTALTILTLALGSAAHAGAPSSVAPPTSAATNSPTPTPTSRAYSSESRMFSSNAADPNFPGATGRVIVRGDNSTIAGDEAATQMEQTGSFEN